MIKRNMKNHLTHVQILNALKVFGMCWRRLYRVLDSCTINTISGPNIDAPLDGNKCCDVISIKRCTAYIFGQGLLPNI